MQDIQRREPNVFSHEHHLEKMRTGSGPATAGGTGLSAHQFTVQNHNLAPLDPVFYGARERNFFIHQRVPGATTPSSSHDDFSRHRHSSFQTPLALPSTQASSSAGVQRDCSPSAQEGSY